MALAGLTGSAGAAASGCSPDSGLPLNTKLLPVSRNEIFSPTYGEQFRVAGLPGPRVYRLVLEAVT
ncbi:hypothetical protein NicSoilB11_12090 [Arthrobacter sp. NicSoilB11]|nr:hypothetical protein NicSoilB11_12090 [Arthrobacter sp. NicSoilB11]